MFQQKLDMAAYLDGNQFEGHFLKTNFRVLMKNWNMLEHVGKM